MLYALILLFAELFADSTLRIDLSLSGTDREQHIALTQMTVSPGWHGRRVNMQRLCLEGNACATLTDELTGDTLYRQSFSTLFQEWQTTEEATRRERSFAEVLRLPMPLRRAVVSIELRDTHHRLSSALSFAVDPTDILIRRSTGNGAWRYVEQNGGSDECIDIAFVAEGYTEGEQELFYDDCQRAVEAIVSHEPFRSRRARFNFVAVPSVSPESGVSEPSLGRWVRSALGAHYDTFYSYRYLTLPSLSRLHDLLEGVPSEHVIVLANTGRYGGGGIFNSYLISSAHQVEETRTVVLVHEFGHSFAGLADEYYYDDQYEPFYPSDTEPWEPNITTLVDFASKWQDMREAGLEVGLWEGGGYQSKGVYRPCLDCRMRTNQAPEFCPVCLRAVERVIDYQTLEQ